MAKSKSKAVLKSEKHQYESQKNWKPLNSPEKLSEFNAKMASKRAKAAEPPKPKQTVKVKRHIDGKYVKGEVPNPSGRPRDGKTQLDFLLAAIRKVETEGNKNLLEHFVRRAFKNDRVLVSVMKKIIPDLQSIAVSPDFDQGMTDEMASQIQQELKERFELPAQAESETPPLIESVVENSI